MLNQTKDNSGFQEIRGMSIFAELALSSRIDGATSNALDKLRKLIHDSKMELSLEISKESTVNYTTSSKVKSGKDKYITETLYKLFRSLDSTAAESLVQYLNSGSETLDEAVINSCTETIEAYIRDNHLDESEIRKINDELLSYIVSSNEKISVADLPYFAREVDWDVESLKAVSLESFEKPDTNKLLSVPEVILTSLATVSNILKVDSFDIKYTPENLPVAYLDMVDSNVPVFSKEVNKRNLFYALNILNSTKQPVYFIASDNIHWTSMVLVTSGNKVNIYYFDSMGGLSTENKTDLSESLIKEMKKFGDDLTAPPPSRITRAIDDLKDFFENIIDEDGQQLIVINDIIDMSVNVQLDYNCGLAAGSFVGAMHSIIEPHINSKSEEVTELFETITKEKLKKVYTKNCLPEKGDLDYKTRKDLSLAAYKRLHGYMYGDNFSEKKKPSKLPNDESKDSEEFKDSENDLFSTDDDRSETAQAPKTFMTPNVITNANQATAHPVPPLIEPVSNLSDIKQSDEEPARVASKVVADGLSDKKQAFVEDTTLSQVRPEATSSQDISDAEGQSDEESTKVANVTTPTLSSDKEALLPPQTKITSDDEDIGSITEEVKTESSHDSSIESDTDGTPPAAGNNGSHLPNAASTNADAFTLYHFLGLELDLSLQRYHAIKAIEQTSSASLPPPQTQSGFMAFCTTAITAPFRGLSYLAKESSLIVKCVFSNSVYDDVKRKSQGTGEASIT